MRELVAEDIPFIRREVPLEEAKAYFQAKGYDDKVRLLAHRRKDYLRLYRLQDHLDYHHGYMVPSTSYLTWFGLSLVEGTDEGFTLRFPRKDNPTELQPPPQYPMLLSAFRQYRNWLEHLGINSVGALDDAIIEGRIDEVILVAEAFHEQYIAGISSQIAGRRDRIRIILISGPSSSGKTTFSKRLSIQLLAQGISPFPLEMDNYFVDREKTPRDENGELDFEAFEALDKKYLNRDLERLIAGERVQLPRYNFKTGHQELGEMIQLIPGQMIILEGIHGLNPALISEIPNEQIFRIYVSTLTQLNLDRQNRISTTDTRLIRRIVRDARERGYSAQETIKRWESVGRGEKRNIFPYQENADVMFNSALVYELSALKELVEPLLRQVPLGSPEYIEAKRLLAMLEWFLPIESDLIPDNSILREFMGNSILRNFKIWQHLL
jgi:uridine kinase